MKRELKKIYYKIEKIIINTGNDEMALFVLLILFIIFLFFASSIKL